MLLSKFGITKAFECISGLRIFGDEVEYLTWHESALQADVGHGPVCSLCSFVVLFMVSFCPVLLRSFQTFLPKARQTSKTTTMGKKKKQAAECRHALLLCSWCGSSFGHVSQWIVACVCECVRVASLQIQVKLHFLVWTSGRRKTHSQPNCIFSCRIVTKRIEWIEFTFCRLLNVICFRLLFSAAGLCLFA